MTRLGLTRRSPLVALALPAALAPGCAVGPNYNRPQAPAPPQYRFVEGPAEAETIADVPWWSITKDVQLQALLRGAIANNLDQRVATARVEEARAQYGIARSFLLAEVNVAAGYSAQQVSRLSEPPQGTAAKKTYQNWSAGFPLSWEIDLFGRLRREKEAAFAAYLATEQGRGAAIVTLVAAVGSTYLFLRELDLQLEVARRSRHERGDRLLLREEAAGGCLEPAGGRPRGGQPPVVDFAEVAGGHNFRPERGTRLKYRYYHKHRGFVEAYEESLCVGCGRCSEACLAGITVPEVIASGRGEEQ